MVRLSKIVTATGDDGTTGLADGSRVRKDDPIICAVGEVDELNSHLGVVLSGELPAEIRKCLTSIQQMLFCVGSELSLPDCQFITSSHIQWLEDKIDLLNSDLPPLEEFILPAGSCAASQTHLARCVCRRVERTICALPDNKNLGVLFNRLSDLLFIVARVLTRLDSDEVYWDRGHTFD